MAIAESEIERWFTFQPISESQKQRADEISVYAKELAGAILRCSSPGPDQTAALRKLRECMWTALSAIQMAG